MGEFKPDPRVLSNALWNDDAMLPYPQNEADISVPKDLLFKPLSRDEMIIQVPYHIMNEKSAFREEKVLILGGDSSNVEEMAPKIKEKEKPIIKFQKNEQHIADIGVQNFKPSNFNFLANFREMDKKQDFDYIRD